MDDEFEEIDDIEGFAPLEDAEDITALFNELGVTSDAADYEIPPEATNEEEKEMVENQIEELEFTEMEEGETPAIPGISDNKQPVNNVDVSVGEVEEIRAGMGYLANVLDEDELAGIEKISNHINDSITILVEKKLDLFSSTVNNNK